MRQADELWAQVVLARAGHRCEGCSSTGSKQWPIDAHHMVPRRFKRTRWDPANGTALCRLCHDEAHRHRQPLPADKASYRPTVAAVKAVIQKLNDHMLTGSGERKKGQTP
jgi:hypothetical protein